MKVTFTRLLGNATQAVAIKSRSGCLLRKQIAMIIPTCHPPTALKHPSIRQRCNTVRPKQSSLSLHLSVTYHQSHHAAPAASLAAHLSLIMMCQLFAGEGAKMASSLTHAVLATQAHRTHSPHCLVAGSIRRTP